MIYKSGFTFIEIILVIVLVGIISVFSVPVFTDLVNRNEINNANDLIVHSLRRAQLLSEYSRNGTSWGMNVVNNNVYIFSGDNFIARDSVFDEVYEIGDNIVVSGDTEIVFSKFTGLPVGSNSLTLERNGVIEIISIDERGVVNY